MIGFIVNLGNPAKTLLVVMFLFGLTNLAIAQDAGVRPMRLGILAGAGYNSAQLDDVDHFLGIPGITDPGKGAGIGLYGGLMYEYSTASRIGAQLRVTYDSRNAAFGANDELKTGLAYLAIEPGIRLNIGLPKFHVMLGPGISVNTANMFDYEGSETFPAVEGVEIDGANSLTLGVWGGLGYDIVLAGEPNGNLWYLTPFAEASWIGDQVASSGGAAASDTWNTFTVRGGIQLKYGFGGNDSPPVSVPEELPVVDLTVRTPRAGIVEAREIIEYFPLLPYVFFEEGKIAIPIRYMTMNEALAESFDEHTLAEKPGTGGVEQQGRSERQMDVYYNAMNIIGDRMRKNASAKLTLVGSAPDKAEGLAMANNVRDYLINSFDIKASRLETKGQTRPVRPSGSRSTPKEDMDLVADENRRVEIISSDGSLMQPVEIRMLEDEPIDNDLVLNMKSDAQIREWNVRIWGDGYDRTYGPFYGPVQRINATTILGERDNGRYSAIVTATTQEGKTLTKESPFTLTRGEVPPVTGQRNSIIFEYDDAKSIETYEKFLRNEVAPKIPNGATVFIHGHTDAIGTEDYNLELSARRAVEVQRMLENALEDMGRNVVFDSYGFGETEFRSPFTNTLPEGRYYNRSVIIEIIPGS